jgi:hypothetical protein
MWMAALGSSATVSTAWRAPRAARVSSADIASFNAVGF